MLRTTLAAHPLPHYEVLSTFWAAACAARGTDLRGKHLVNLEVLGPVPDGLIAELVSKLRPASVKYGLAKAGFGEPFDTDLADAHESVLTNEPCRSLVQEMPAPMRDFGMDGSHSPRPASPLGNRQFRRIPLEMPRVADLFATGKHSQILQPQVDSNLTSAAIIELPELDLDVEIPSSPTVLGEAPNDSFASSIARCHAPESS